MDQCFSVHALQSPLSVRVSYAETPAAQRVRIRRTDTTVKAEMTVFIYQCTVELFMAQLVCRWHSDNPSSRQARASEDFILPSV